MLDLKRAAGRYGLRTEVVEASPSSLYGYLPAIARLTSTDESEGHYVVVVSKEPDHLVLVDGSSNLLIKYDVGKFERAYSGYSLVPTNETKLAVVPYLILLAFGSVGIVATLWRRNVVRG